MSDNDLAGERFSTNDISNDLFENAVRQHEYSFMKLSSPFCSSILFLHADDKLNMQKSTQHISETELLTNISGLTVNAFVYFVDRFELKP